MSTGTRMAGTGLATAVALAALLGGAMGAPAQVSFELLDAPVAGVWADFSLSRDGSQMGCVMDGAVYWWSVGEGFRFLDPGVPLGGGVGMAADGAALVGARGGSGGPVPTVWYRDGRVQDLGSLAHGCDVEHDHDSGYDLSAGAQVVVGQSTTCAREVAFVWTRDAGLRGLATPAGGDSRSVAVSADGRVVVGFCEHPVEGYRRPALWRDGKGPDLLLGPLRTGEALGISLDGTRIVGQAVLGGPYPQAFLWSADGGSINLGSLGGTSASSLARAVSDDGRVVGWSGDALWDDQVAFLWTAGAGMRALVDILTDHGVEVPAGMVLTAALDISGDGKTVVGTARDRSWNLRYWRVRLETVLDTPQAERPRAAPTQPDTAALPDSFLIQDADMLSPFPFTKRRY